MAVSKPRVIKDFEKLENKIQEQIKLVYPEGLHSRPKTSSAMTTTMMTTAP